MKWPTHLAAPLLSVLLPSCAPAPSTLTDPPDTAPADSAALPDGASTNWFTTVQARIAAEAKAIRPRDGAFTADLPSVGLSARLDDDGVTVSGDEGEALSFRTAGWGRADDLMSVGSRTPALGECTAAIDAGGRCIQRLEYADPELTEWWIGLGTGLEQGWTVAQAPQGDGPLVIDVAVESALGIDGHGEDVVITDATGRAWSVAEVAASDANGDPLPARVVLTDEGLRIEVEDAGAAYPIEVDPVYETAAWTVTGLTGNAPFGVSASSAGDVNGDGYDDVIVGADLYGLGLVYAYLGSAVGLSTTPASTIIGEDEIGFGAPVAAAGDVNGDGYDDILVGAVWYGGGYGRVYVYLGSADGLATAPAISLTGATDERFGEALAAAGDVNGDGYDDVVVGAYKYDSYTGRAFVYEGSSGGITSTAAATMVGTATAGEFGYSVAGAGDVNGDGYGDVVIGAEGAGLVGVYLGSALGLATTAATTLTGEGASDRFGYSVASAGDVNGDGYDDVLVGALYANSGTGGAYVYSGSSSGVSGAPTTTLYGEGPSYFGRSLGSGDLNGDGYDDIIVGAPWYDSWTGRAYVYAGSSAGLSITATTLSGETSGDSFGYTLSGAGDVNGDGYDDVIVAAEGYDSSTGRVYVYAGSASGLPATADTTLTGATTSDQLGYSVAGAGDVNGDGYDDVIVAAYEYEAYTGRAYVYQGSSVGLSSAASTTLSGGAREDGFGISVSAAGDVNGDGYSDVIVGAYGVSSFAGRAYVYEGSSGGLSPSASTTLVGEAGLYFGSSVSGAGDVNGDGYDDVIVGNWYYSREHGRAYVYIGSSTGVGSTASTTLIDETGGYFGKSVSGAGDVNGDGYGDVLVGAPSVGAAYVYQGSAGGLSTTPSASLTGESSRPYFGYSVSDAGDVNGDGYGDVMVGAEGGYGNESAAYFYAGSSTGLSTTAATTLVGEARSDYLGCSVSSAGDLDGDGYDDVIVGAYGYGSESGRAYVYSGSSAGLSSVASTTLTGEATANGFGYSVSGAGDVNGDGHDDVIVGAPYFESSGGRVYLFFGAVDADADGISEEFDCDDTDPTIGAGFTLHADEDGDTFGAADGVTLCLEMAGFVDDSTDCDDAAPAIHPGATELPGDLVDQDCDGTDLCFVDADDDGFRSDASTVASPSLACDGSGEAVAADALGDCNDTDPAVHPGATEIAGDLSDEDCEGTELCFVDADDDGYRPEDLLTVSSPNVACDSAGEALATDGLDDCNDTNPAIHPGGMELPGDGIDQDCNDSELCFVDADDDSFRPDAAATLLSTNIACTGTGQAVASDGLDDCDDADASVFPTAEDIPRDGIDQDCDGEDATGPAHSGGKDDAGGCGCASTNPGSAWTFGLALLGLGVRRRRAE